MPTPRARRYGLLAGLVTARRERRGRADAVLSATGLPEDLDLMPLMPAGVVPGVGRRLEAGVPIRPTAATIAVAPMYGNTGKWSHMRGNMQIQEKMQVDALLCNHAESVNNLLYISGGGIGSTLVPPGTNPPYTVNLAMAIMVTVPWNLSNQQHELEIQLVTEDGQPVLVPSTPDSMQPVHVRLAFNVGRPPTITIGDDQQVCLAANLPGLPLAALGKYEFIIRVDGDNERRLPFRLQPMAGAQMLLGPGVPG